MPSDPRKLSTRDESWRPDAEEFINLEEIAPEDKTRNEVLGAHVDIYMAAKKWDMAAAVASHLVKVDPPTAGWWDRKNDPRTSGRAQIK